LFAPKSFVTWESPIGISADIGCADEAPDRCRWVRVGIDSLEREVAHATGSIGP
jgi:hypothetical protein